MCKLSSEVAWFCSKAMSIGINIYKKYVDIKKKECLDVGERSCMKIGGFNLLDKLLNIAIEKFLIVILDLIHYHEIIVCL